MSGVKSTKQKNTPGQIIDGGIDAGLICLAAARKPGQVFSMREIAFVCGVSHGWPIMVEQKALRKIRARLRRELNISYARLARGETI